MPALASDAEGFTACLALALSDRRFRWYSAECHSDRGGGGPHAGFVMASLSATDERPRDAAQHVAPVLKREWPIQSASYESHALADRTASARPWCGAQWLIAALVAL